MFFVFFICSWHNITSTDCDLTHKSKGLSKTSVAVSILSVSTTFVYIYEQNKINQMRKISIINLGWFWTFNSLKCLCCKKWMVYIPQQCVQLVSQHIFKTKSEEETITNQNLFCLMTLNFYIRCLKSPSW